MNKLKKDKTYNAALKVVNELQSTGHTAYFVGGIVRDMLLGVESKDIDIVTSALPDVVDSLFKRTHHIGAAFGIINVVEQGINFEVATFREEREYNDGRHPEEVHYTTDPKLDAVRRDFTINGMFYNPVTEEIHDFVNGQADLKRGILTTIDDPEIRFKEDYLRMMRAVRFSNRFGFTLDPNTATAITKFSENVTKLSAERVRDELSKMLTGQRPAQSLIQLEQLGILTHILPQVSALTEIQDPHQTNRSLFESCIQMLQHMAVPSIELAWSIMLRNLGTTDSSTTIADTAQLAEQIMKEMRFSKKETVAVVEAISSKLQFDTIHEKPRAHWRRIMSRNNFPIELELYRIDCLCHTKTLANYELMLERVHLNKYDLKLPKPLLTGGNLIQMGFKPGPHFSKLITTLMNKQLNEEITTKQQALTWANGQKKSPSSI